ncbi:S41 family peptidase [Streptomyces europaeiscabiei]|uniref:S41 family peptidase n=1 Tax=Streptomyces europaeiscabiei TaxID=146819 RepID=UPI0006284EFD|nr:S41 family peptidase [Streptomyces europaeiscabiei]MDX2523779.1 PDZ domain-containing protein [Streptomyces europaeiscabiei]MDX2764132.1 PDZ domain-containing protein [Streptomyces europaeiscabiei]MDX2772116.1 PDZ domain-containing protein [Streptomyces europaeiscabiei]MDX3666675.1 PDZ domain-containing protein [Streptomyces europaeiscabiei]MDX3712791.1 PDZ domain-containing protein [Streptomyces europaeiscabiei]
MTQLAYFRYPHLHGDLVAFTAEDDVWVAPLDGGRAWRVSADNVPVNHPRISPDGTTVAWTSTRDGAPEVHVAPVDGGSAKRLTYWGSWRTQVRGWTPDGQVLALSTQGQASLRRSWARAVPLDGGPATTLPYGPVGDVAHGPATVLLSAPMGREAAWWKRYRGGTAGKLWIDRAAEDGKDTEGTGPAGEFVRLHAELDGNIEYPLWVGDRIAFLSDHEGVGALYSSLADGSDLRRHTPVDGFYARHAATDGTRVVYTSAGELWLLDDLDGAEPRRLDIRLGGQRVDLQPFPANASRWFGSASPDHTARGSAVSVRGSVHWITHRSGPARALAAEQGVRARLPRTFRVEGEEWVVWVTDAEGDDALEFAPATGVGPGATPRRLAAGQLGRVLGLAVAPDGSRVAVATHDGRVLLVERESGEVREVDRSEDGEVTGLVFSPDSAWLAWSHPGPRPLRQLKLANTADLSVTEATPLRFQDFSPAFTLDGKHLAFLSARAFDPVYDEHVFDLHFVSGARPHLITLAATTPSPFGPQRHGRPFEAPDKDETPDSEGAPATRIDLEGLADRIVPFPVEAARYSTLRAAKDGVLWLHHPVTGVLGHSRATPDDPDPKSSLERYDLAQRRLEYLASDADHFTVSGDGKRVLLWTDGKLKVVPSDRRASNDDESDTNITVDLSRVRRTVDPAAEWRQMFDETGRLMRDNFWRPDLGGVDWDGVLDRYRPVLDRLATHDDLVDLLWEVQGELGTSHAYVTPRGRGGSGDRRQGLLGADVSRHEDGPQGSVLWRIDRVLPSETSDPDAHSPLAAPGVAVRAGDAIVAVGGQPVDPVAGPGPLLVGTAGKAVELTVLPSGGGDLRHPVVVPISDEEPLRYHAWVADRRAYVHERSGGRLGYLHVPDMVGSGWAQLHRDLRIEVAREGLVVDVRENRGGHTSQLVVEKLARRIVGWDLPRGMRPTSYPDDAPRGPVVAVANEFSGSDGDIVNAAIKALGIGPVVGTRTWGGVVGIDSRYRLVDGTLVTQPKYAFWLEGYGWGVENHGVDPDVEVVQAPQDYAAGRDPQLDEAIRIALEGLESTPAKTAPPLPET